MCGGMGAGCLVLLRLEGRGDVGGENDLAA